MLSTSKNSQNSSWQFIKILKKLTSTKLERSQGRACPLFLLLVEGERGRDRRWDEPQRRDAQCKEPGTEQHGNQSGDQMGQHPQVPSQIYLRVLISSSFTAEVNQQSFELKCVALKNQQDDSCQHFSFLLSTSRDLEEINTPYSRHYLAIHLASLWFTFLLLYKFKKSN